MLEAGKLDVEGLVMIGLVAISLRSNVSEISELSSGKVVKK